MIQSVPRSEPRTSATKTAPQAAREYAELKNLIRQNGLLEKQPVYYTCKMVLLLGLFALSVAFLILVHPFWLQILNAIFLAFVTTQLGLLGHEAGHRQIFHKTWKNDFVGLIAGNVLIGMSNSWWMNKHNKHHSHPNQSDLDPDINIPLLSFTGEDIAQKGKFTQFVNKYQAFFFFPLLLLVALDLQKSSIRFLFRNREKYHAVEVTLILIHIVAYVSILFFFLGFWQALLFMLVHQCLAGLYLGSIFAPNHKGMPILDSDCDMGFLYRQVVTARNVKGHPITDFWYGGLNYQIEHHLFPSMPRNRLPKAHRITKAFCEEHVIPYHETSMLRSYSEILQHLHRVSAPFRKAHPMLQ